MSCVAICGDSGSGKTTMAKVLSGYLLDSIIIECDGYHKWERHDPHWNEYTHLHPEANHISLMNENVLALKNGESIHYRQYDHKTGTFLESQEVGPNSNVIVTGLHTFMCPDNLYDVKIFMDTDPVLKTQWKIARDTSRRGYSLEQVKLQIQNRKRDYDLFLQPLVTEADVVVNFYNETDVYIDSIKGIGRCLRIFIKNVHDINNILKEFDALDVDYIFARDSRRSEFCEFDIINYKSINNGYYYDHVAGS
jgi:phosphoribulokinase